VSSDQHILAIGLGTSGCKVALVSDLLERYMDLLYRP
jgi:sugar (pentulose or hexulose) kinase